MFDLSTDLTILLLICLLCACVFEFINGFHDTANAVATVIYTNSLKPVTAVIWSGMWNFLGVLLGGTAVAMGIIKLLPSGVLTDQNLMHNVAMILSLLIAAIIWNLGTWYFGIPASSSHTLIGSILGVGIAYTLTGDGDLATGVNWKKAGDIGLSLLISPLLGFLLTILMMWLFRMISKNPRLFNEPDRTRKPPVLVRALLILTCTGVSFSHGSNDGQKGIGLVMLILIAIVPAHFALNHETKIPDFRTDLAKVQAYYNNLDSNIIKGKDWKKIEEAKAELLAIDTISAKYPDFSKVPLEEAQIFRTSVILLSSVTEKVVIDKGYLKGEDASSLKSAGKALAASVDYSPRWVVLMISICLGLGTMIGWKRIVKTIGEKIGKEHLSYAQGASAELVAASTIQIATATGLPVSTTQVLSSGIAGSMVASNGFKNLQGGTVKNILIAWLLTLPVTVILSGGTFLILRSIL
jgi:PiT family inorganic phosphate transporter